METGKVEYAPDYKSKSQVKRIAAQRGLPPVSSPDQLIEAAQRIWNDSEAAKERARLEREVIETAKADRRASTKGDGRNADIDSMIKTRNAHNAAIDALIQFESQHGIETKE